MQSDHPVYLIFVGPPGAGKGTQAAMLEEELGLKQVSSGDLFRENLKNQTELGLLAKSYMDRGELVPDNVTISMIEERLSRPDCEKGAILDGFPRTLEQAKAAGMRMIDETARGGIRGSRVAFVHPAATGSVLTEIVEPAKVAH